MSRLHIFIYPSNLIQKSNSKQIQDLRGKKKKLKEFKSEGCNSLAALPLTHSTP